MSSDKLKQMIDEQKGRPRFTVAPLSRWRWNVLDLINICNAGSVPTYLFCDIDMSWAEEYRRLLAQHGMRVTVTALIIKAIAIAQTKHPESRTAMLPWGQVVTINDIIGSFTVERFIDGKPAVYFGTIEAPHTKSVAQIAQELKENGELEMNKVPQLDLEHRFAKMPWLLRRLILWVGLRFPSMRLNCLGATFGISSLGKYAMKLLIPPCVCTSTFGIGAVENRPVVRGGEVVVRPIMSLALNFDHRLIDGAPAARFLQDVRLLLEGGLKEYVEWPEVELQPQPVQVTVSVSG